MESLGCVQYINVWWKWRLHKIRKIILIFFDEVSSFYDSVVTHFFTLLTLLNKWSVNWEIEDLEKTSWTLETCTLYRPKLSDCFPLRPLTSLVETDELILTILMTFVVNLTRCNSFSTCLQRFRILPCRT